MRSRQIIYGCTVCAVFVMNIVYTEYLPFLLLWILLLFPLLMLAYTLVLRKNLTITLLEKKETAIRGDMDEYRVHIKNTAILPIPALRVCVTYQYDNYHVPQVLEHTAFVNSIEETDISGHIMLEYVGRLTIHLSKSYLYDPLRLFAIPLKQTAQQEVMVMPVLAEPDYYTMYTAYDNLTDASEYSAKRSGEDPSEVFDVRTYRAGDSLNRIHWKLSAKEDDLVVKEFGQPVSSSNCILLELDTEDTKEGRECLNGIYELGYAISNLACRKERTFILAYYSSSLGCLRTHRITALEELEEAVRLLIGERTYAGRKTFEAYLESELLSMENCFYITSHVDEIVVEYVSMPSEQNRTVYCIDHGMGRGEVTRFGSGILQFVDCNEVRQGLRTVMM